MGLARGQPGSGHELAAAAAAHSHDEDVGAHLSSGEIQAELKAEQSRPEIAIIGRCEFPFEWPSGTNFAPGRPGRALTKCERQTPAKLRRRDGFIWPHLSHLGHRRRRHRRRQSKRPGRGDAGAAHVATRWEEIQPRDTIIARPMGGLARIWPGRLDRRPARRRALALPGCH